MNLENYRENYYELSRPLSEVVRILNFAGIVLIWICWCSDNSEVIFPIVFSVPLFFILISLFFDFLQYFWGSLIWGFWTNWKEKNEKILLDQKLKAPDWFNWPTIVFFWIKSISVFLAYCFLLKILCWKIF